MYVSGLNVVRIKSFVDASALDFSPSINLLVGPNNSGKSTLIKSILRLQYTNVILNDNRTEFGEIHVSFANVMGFPHFEGLSGALNLRSTVKNFTVSLTASDARLVLRAGALESTAVKMSAVEPDNFIVPFLSSRKVAYIEQVINSTVGFEARLNLSNIVSKIDQLRDPAHSRHAFFDEACKEILGFPISTFLSPQGKEAGLRISDSKVVSLDQMGDGSAHIVGILAYIATAKGRLFLIEEIENDVHPKALKKVLQLIAEAATDNQFIISTHSNIVTKYLGSEPGSKIFKIKMERVGGEPQSNAVEVASVAEERMSLLEELGYEFSDFGHWDGWLILEESSAERIIREFLIPWFVPDLSGKLRTIASKGIDDVEPRFNDLQRLFTFVHLQSVYVNRAWVIVDGDEQGEEAVDKLATSTGWDRNHFRTWTQSKFEMYYPENFRPQLEEILELKGKPQWELRKELCKSVVDWARGNEEEAKVAFSTSAAEVVEALKEIAAALGDKTSG